MWSAIAEPPSHFTPAGPGYTVASAIGANSKVALPLSTVKPMQYPTEYYARRKKTCRINVTLDLSRKSAIFTKCQNQNLSSYEGLRTSDKPK